MGTEALPEGPHSTDIPIVLSGRVTLKSIFSKLFCVNYQHATHIHIHIYTTCTHTFTCECVGPKSVFIYMVIVYVNISICPNSKISVLNEI